MPQVLIMFRQNVEPSPGAYARCRTASQRKGVSGRLRFCEKPGCVRFYPPYLSQTKNPFSRQNDCQHQEHLFDEKNKIGDRRRN